jgi:hypothetical protein
VNNIIRVGEELFLVKHNIRDEYNELALEWNKIGPEKRSFKRDGRLYLCEVIEEATIIEDEEVIEENVDTTSN